MITDFNIKAYSRLCYSCNYIETDGLNFYLEMFIIIVNIVFIDIVVK